VKLPDVNLLLYAYDASSANHVRAKDWLEAQLSGVEAFDIVDSWLAAPCATVAHPGSRHAILLRQLLEPLGSGGNLTTDAHLAAIALEHDAELCSADADFSRFPGLRRSNPLVA